MSKKIYPDRKYHVPVMNGERQLYLASTSIHIAKFYAAISENIGWKELEKQGWTIESFWGSEYE